MPEPRDVPDLLNHLLTDPGRPRLTWYGPDGERVELSAKVLDNWVAKTANLLVEELDAGPGRTVGIDLPTHWRTVVWLLATWSAGAHAVIAPAPDDAPDVLVTTDADRAKAASGLVVAVALPALATSFGPGLPPGALDAASEVRRQSDVFTLLDRPAPADPAWSHAGRTVPHGDLLAVAREGATGAGAGPGDRVLATTGPDDALTAWLGPLALDGSLVLGAVDARLRAQEGVTALV